MPRKLVSTKDLSRDEWLTYRKKSIGGSDAASIIGLNPWASKFTVWADKKGLLPEKEDTEAMRQGRDLEDYVAKRWEEETSKKVHRTNFMYLHDDYDFISANVDRLVTGEDAGLECKTTSVFNKSDFANGNIPLTYYCQCQHYMAVMGFKKMYLAVLVLNKGFYHFEIERNEAEINALIKSEIDFWNTYIIGDKIPEADGSETTTDAISKIYNKELPETKILSPEFKNTADKLTEIKQHIKELKEAENIYTQALQLQLGNYSAGSLPGYKISWKAQKRKSIDSTRLKAEMPEIYNKFVKETESRVFRLTKLKEAI